MDSAITMNPSSHYTGPHFQGKPQGWYTISSSQHIYTSCKATVAMVYSVVTRMKDMRVILASKSPRRRDLLEKQLGIPLTIVPSTFNEDLDKSKYSTPQEYVKDTCLGKLNEVGSRPGLAFDVLIAADTVVIQGGRILEKPQDREHAIEMLASLSNTEHIVCSAVAISRKREGSEAVIKAFTVDTKVRFANLSKKDIEAYVDTGEPMDKAGGYGIQALGATLVTGIEGCYYNVMGFPLQRFCAEMEDLV
eukprot:Clim_evm20s139 gene=Clim_evmTU20s139